MKITIDRAGKRFNFEWILQNISVTFHSNCSYAILGPNGSGKSTLLQLIAGVATPSAGSVIYSMNEKRIEDEEVFSFITMAAPYIELIEEFTAQEMISFQKNFKPLLKNIREEDVLRIARLERDHNKPIKVFSSGMKQRLKLSLALLTDAPVILLDEPSTNLDQEGFEWYLDLVRNYLQDRMLILCSNLEREYQFCDEIIDVMKFKAAAAEINSALP